MWPENFQLFKLDLEKAGEPEFKSQTPPDHQKSQRVPEKHVFYWLCQSFSQHHNNLWKILQETGIPAYLICFLRNLYAGQKETVRTRHGKTDSFPWFQIGKGIHQGCILSLCFFSVYAEYIMRNVGLDEAQAGIKIAGRNINNLKYAMTLPLWQKVNKK